MRKGLFYGWSVYLVTLIIFFFGLIILLTINVHLLMTREQKDHIKACEDKIEEWEK